MATAPSSRPPWHLHRRRSWFTAATITSVARSTSVVGGGAAERQPQRAHRRPTGRHPSPRARATAPSPRWRTPMRPRRTRRPRRAGTAAPRSRRRSMHTCAEPATLRALGTVSTHAVESALQSVDEPVAERGDADRLAVAFGVGQPQRDGHARRSRRRCACRCAARAPGRRRRAAASTVAPSRTTSTPTPFGPPNLWRRSDSRSTCGVISRRSSQHARLHRVGVQQRVGRMAAHDRGRPRRGR